MSKNVCSIFGLLLSTGLLAQTATSPTPLAIETPGAAPAATNAPASEATSTNVSGATTTKAPTKTAKKNGKKKPAHKAEELRSVPLTPGPAEVQADHVNVRGQAKLNSEVVTRLTKGQQVQVIEEINLKNSGPDEPSAWAKIVLPPGAHAWLSSSYIDPATQTVKPRRLNVRSGPGENYSVLGRLERGESVKSLNSKGDWTEIEPPTNTYAFVAAQFLKQEPPSAGPVASTETNQPAATVADAQPVAPAPTDNPAPTTPDAAVATNAPSPTETAAATNAPSATETAAATNAPPAPAIEEPPPPRIVQREGIVRGTFSIQAPTPYALVSPENGRTINYLYTTAKDLDLSRWKGLRIIVTGEEGLDERWRNTPVITIQRIQVLDER
jgi:uncharacterized protein YgiM (DUF1202 family)